MGPPLSRWGEKSEWPDRNRFPCRMNAACCDDRISVEGRIIRSRNEPPAWTLGLVENQTSREARSVHLVDGGPPSEERLACPRRAGVGRLRQGIRLDETRRPVESIRLRWQRCLRGKPSVACQPCSRYQAARSPSSGARSGACGARGDRAGTVEPLFAPPVTPKGLSPCVKVVGSRSATLASTPVSGESDLDVLGGGS